MFRPSSALRPKGTLLLKYLQLKVMCVQRHLVGLGFFRGNIK